MLLSPKHCGQSPPQPEPLGLPGEGEQAPIPALAGSELMGRGPHRDGDQPQGTPQDPCSDPIPEPGMKERRRNTSK